MRTVDFGGTVFWLLSRRRLASLPRTRADLHNYSFLCIVGEGSMNLIWALDGGGFFFDGQ